MVPSGAMVFMKRRVRMLAVVALMAMVMMPTIPGYKINST